MRKSKKKNRKRFPWSGLSQRETDKRWPFKLPIIEHLVLDTRKIKNTAIVLTALNLVVKPTQDGKWFDIVEA